MLSSARMQSGGTTTARRPRCAAVGTGAPLAAAAPASRCRRCTRAAAPPRAAAPRVPLTTQQLLKTQMTQLVTRLNGREEGDDPRLQAQLLGVIDSLAALTPTPRPAESPLINTTWALLYTLPAQPKGDVRRSPLQQLLAALYDVFYKYAPILAGSAVGRKADSRSAVKARGQFQIFDVPAGWVSNQARFSLLGQQGVIQVDGPAKLIDDSGGIRIEATFTEAELRWGRWVRIPFPIRRFSPTGYIDTLYLDSELRVSKGDKGSIFIARKADDAGAAPFLQPSAPDAPGPKQ